MRTLQGRTAVITGAASGFGLEVSRVAAREGMCVVMADVQQPGLDTAAAQVRELGAEVLALEVDVSRGEQVEELGQKTRERFGVPHFVFNNAGVSTGGLIWEHTQKDWDWVIGVNLMGVVHGVRVFTPMMLQAAAADRDYEGHIVNTASMAGLVNAPNLGVYNATKHAVVGLSETLYQDLALVTDQVHASVLCPYFVPTGIHLSHRNRPAEMLDGSQPTRSQVIAQAMSERAVTRGKVTAAEIAEKVFDAVRERRFYIFSHPQGLAPVKQRAEHIVLGKNPPPAYAERPDIDAALRAALRSPQN